MDGYSISQVAERCGVSINTLRYYEAEGLVPPIGRDGSGKRVFLDTDVAWARYAVCLRKLGMRVADISRYVAAAHSPDGVQEQMSLLVEHIGEMRRQRDELDHFIAVTEAKLTTLAEKR